MSLAGLVGLSIAKRMRESEPAVDSAAHPPYTICSDDRLKEVDEMSKFFIGFVSGIFVGWVIGILSAPQSGKETLDSLSDRAIELRDRTVNKAEQIREDLAPEA